ncbi:MAG: phospho-N-acetylmuramoyl-pentapeptide-transferase [Planctomycetota bacterium]
MLNLLVELAARFGIGGIGGFGTSFRAAGAAVTAFVLMMVMMPRLIAWLRRKRFGEKGAKGDGAIVVDSMRRAKAGTPTMGGLGLIAVVFIAALIWCDPREPQIPLLLFTLVAFGLLGYVDDRAKVFRGAQGMSKTSKLLLQLAVGLACGLWFYFIDAASIIPEVFAKQEATGWIWRSGGPVDAPHRITLPLLAAVEAPYIGIGIVVWTLVMTFACSNSVNFTDGMDGLSSGVMLIASLAFMVIAYLASHFVAAHYLGIFYVPGCQDVAVFCAGLAGGCLGFLWFNSHPAEVFMGDTGSQSLGGVLAVVAMCCKQEVLILLVGFIFFLEGFSVLLQVAVFRATGGKRLFLCAPLHHHFQYKGWPETKIVQRFWIVAAVTALLALATLRLR